MTRGKGLLPGWLARFAAKLRYPQLFLLTAAIFGIDLLIPDLLPMVDEILLGLATLALGSMREERREKNVTPPDGPQPPG